MSNFLPCSFKDNLCAAILIGSLIAMASQTGLSGTPTKLLSYTSIDIQQVIAQPSHANSSVVNNDKSDQDKPETIMEASGHFANNQLKGGTVTWIQGGYWNLQIDAPNSNHNNQTSSNADKNNNTAMFIANFTMIKPDGSLSHSHTISNFSSNEVIITDNDIVVTGIADIHSDNGLEYDQVPLIVHLMGKKVLGLTIDVGKTEGHFSGTNEMFGTLISGVGIEGSKTNKTMMGSGDSVANESSDKTPMAMMHH